MDQTELDVLENLASSFPVQNRSSWCEVGSSSQPQMSCLKSPSQGVVCALFLPLKTRHYPLQHGNHSDTQSSDWLHSSMQPAYVEQNCLRIQKNVLDHTRWGFRTAAHSPFRFPAKDLVRFAMDPGRSLLHVLHPAESPPMTNCQTACLPCSHRSSSLNQKPISN